MGATLFEFNLISGNNHSIAYVPTQPDKSGKVQKPFPIEMSELDHPINKLEIMWGAMSSLQTRRKSFFPDIPVRGRV